MFLKKIPLLIFFFIWFIPVLAQKPGYWQQQADYTIEVRLNDTVHTLDGHVNIRYVNNSPDTLNYLWIHLWPNAYKNDRTAYAEQSLLEGDLRFYFSKPHQKGYINKVNFTANGQLANLEDHPQHIDVVKLNLPQPLFPGSAMELETGFHVQLPQLYSRSGYSGSYHAIAQWFPKVAMYDADGWHPMPYLSAGEFYSNFGNYRVSISVPENYVVAATGMLKHDGEKEWMKQHLPQPSVQTDFATRVKSMGKAKNPNVTQIQSASRYKTLEYEARSVVDFAWVADKNFQVKFDTLQLNSRVIEIWNFQHPGDYETWQNSMRFTKQALRFYSEELGDYPYPQMSIVTSPDKGGGMEYPMLTTLNAPTGDQQLLDLVIAHETGHNWLQATLATNERMNAWMDEGINTYFEQKYMKQYGQSYSSGTLFGLSLTDATESFLDILEASRKSTPVQTNPYEAFPYPYYTSVYPKAGRLLNDWEKQFDEEKMHQLFIDYYETWKFAHPAPGDFYSLARKHLDNGVDISRFSDSGFSAPRPTGISFKFGTQLGPGKSTRYIGYFPALGFNNHDKIELGLLLHNYTLPASRFRFAITPMYATGSQSIVGYGHMVYDIFPTGKLHIFQPFLNFGHFHFRTAADPQNGKELKPAFTRLVPGFRMEWKPKTALTTFRKGINFKTYFITEQQIRYRLLPPPDEMIFIPERAGANTRIIPELNFNLWDIRKLYPWDATLQFQQVGDLLKSTITANYFLNYDAGGKGASVRFFAGKIFYLKEKTLQRRSDNALYHFTMQGLNGVQDYTYSTPFAERNQSPEIWGRQIGIANGGFKYRSDYSSVIPGLKPQGVDYFDNWIMAANFTVDLPRSLNRLNLPIKLFADIGTSHSPWTPGAEEEKFLYSIGAQLSLWDAINIYLPLMQSKAFNEPNSYNNPNRPGGSNFWEERITFSINPAALKKKLKSQFIY